MKTGTPSILIRSVMALVLVLGLVLQDVSPAYAIVRCYVKWNAAGLNNGTSWANAYKSLQSALGGSACTEVWVAAGAYYPTSGTNRTISFALKSGVAIYGGFVGTETLRSQRNPAANVTLLSGNIGNGWDSDNSYHVVVAYSASSTAVLDGFTIGYGNANGDWPAGGGGGIFVDGGSPSLRNLIIQYSFAAGGGGGMVSLNSSSTLQKVRFNSNTTAGIGGGLYNLEASPTLNNVIFNNNSASGGGAIANWQSSPILKGVQFNGNSADHYGGAMHNNANSSPSLLSVTFTSNSADQGGGAMYSAQNSSPSLRNVTFDGNSANTGGAVLNQNNSSPSFTNGTFRNNSAVSGGAVFSQDSNPTLLNVTFSGNSAVYGGGMYIYASSPSLTNATFTGNSATQLGGGMYNGSSAPSLRNVTFYGNWTLGTPPSGGAMYNADGSSTTIKNSILYADGNSEITNDASSAAVSYSIVQGGYPGTGNLSANPLLGSLQNNGGLTQTLALGTGSPAIDKGTNSGCPAKDQRGIVRPQGLRCDMGAYEKQQSRVILSSLGPSDGWVLESSESSGLGGTFNAGSQIFNLGDDAADRQFRTILSFSTSALPDNAVLTSATLRIRNAGSGGTDPFSTHGKILVDLRKGVFGGNAALQAVDFQAPPSQYASISIANSSWNGWYSGKVKPAGLALINKLGLTQFRLRFTADDNDDLSADYLTFFSGDSLLAVNRPKLVVTYYLP